MSLVHEALEKAERERCRRQEGAPHAKKKIVMEHSTDSGGSPSPEITLRLKRLGVPNIYNDSANKSRLGQWLFALKSKKRLVIVALSVIACLVSFLLWNGVEMNPSDFDEETFGGYGENGLLVGSQQRLRESELATSNEEKAFRLSGIMADPEGTFCAVLNGYIVYPGEKIPGGTIREITREAVLLDTPGHSIELRLN